MVVGKNGAELYCGQWPEPNDPAFYFSVFSQREMEIAHFHRRSWKESKSCLFVCRTFTFVVAIGRRKKTFWWSLGAPHNMAKRRRSFFSPTRCLWEHSTFSSICFYITVQAWTNNESSLGTSILRFLSFFSSTTYRKNEIIPVDFFLISSGKKWKWSLSLSFFFC